MDLVVWPESSYPDIALPEHTEARRTRNRQWHSNPDEGAAAAKGMISPGLTDLPGNIAAVHRQPLCWAPPSAPVEYVSTSACLVELMHAVQRHDKTVLMPFYETFLRSLKGTGSAKRSYRRFGLTPFGFGNAYRLLTFTTRSGRGVRLAVSVWLTARCTFLGFRSIAAPGGALVHLTNESWAAAHPSLSQIENWACQYRAITETCALATALHFTGKCAAVVDPRGCIRASLQGNPGTILAPLTFARAFPGKSDADGTNPAVRNAAR